MASVKDIDVESLQSKPLTDDDDGANDAEANLESSEVRSLGASNNPPEGRKLFFEDRVRRIDYILVWETQVKDVKVASEREQARGIFESNLVKEGLQLEHDIQEDRNEQYTKIHAPWEVLTRYAELMRLRMPIKEVPKKVESPYLFEVMADFFKKVMSPFQLDEAKVPPIPKKYTHLYERGKEYLFDIPIPNKELFFSHATRSMIVDYILRRKRYCEGTANSIAFGIKSLLNRQIYCAAYSLHEGSWKPSSKPSMRKLLYEHWACWRNFYKRQPLDHIRVYYGEKVALYFCWLGYYTYFLISASILGLIVFIYGMVTFGKDIVSKESCDWSNNFTMCPKCEHWCPYWNYAATCNDVRASHLFDNGATVFFAVFMSLWGTFFLEFWKRKEAAIQFKWNLMNFQQEEEPPRPEYMAELATCSRCKTHPISGMVEPYRTFWKQRVPVYVGSFTVMLALSLLAVGVVIGIIVYRMSVLAALYLQEDEIFYKNASLVTSSTAAIINLVLIFILNWVYSFVAVKLTDWETLRTQTEYDSSLTFKLYVLQFVNYYSSLFYIAFFKGRFAGGPHRYKRLFGARQEECQGGGCLMELCIQLAIIFVGKQLLTSLVEIGMPRVMKAYKMYCKAGKTRSEKLASAWEKDYLLYEMGPRGMFTEYLEMLLQFGFVTIFVAAFPLAPLFALFNNIIEIRSDANKFVTQMRRPMALRAQTIGVWRNVLYAVSRLAILTNACIIAVTSTFIDRLVYEMRYSEDGTLHGFVNNSLAYFNVSDFSEYSRYVDEEKKFQDVVFCRYSDYRAPPWAVAPQRKYKYTTQFWHILAAKFIFIVVFQNTVVVVTGLIAYLIPDMPRKLHKEACREAYLTNEIILRAELEIAQGRIVTNRTIQDLRRRINSDYSMQSRKGSNDDVERGRNHSSEKNIGENGKNKYQQRVGDETGMSDLRKTTSGGATSPDRTVKSSSNNSESDFTDAVFESHV